MQVDHFPARHRQLLTGFGELREAIPDVMAGFANLHRAATEDGELSKVTKELIAVAIAIAVHCDGCVAFHVHDALRAGATRAQVEEAIGVAILMGGGPAAVYAADAMRAIEEFAADFESAV